MTKRKTRRSRCASDTCGKQFRHADPNAATCSPACRQRVSRINRKAEQERVRTAAAYQWIALRRKRQDEAKAEQDAAERSATARHVEEGSPPSQPARHLYHLVDADKLGRCGVHQLGGDHATSVKEFRTLAGLGVDLCKGCVGAVNRALERREREWIGGIGPLGTRAPEAGGITITIPKRAPMTPLNSRR